MIWLRGAFPVQIKKKKKKKNTESIVKSQKWDEKLRKKRKIIDVEKSDTEKPIGVSMRPGC